MSTKSDNSPRVEPARRIAAIVYPGPLEQAFVDLEAEFQALARIAPDEYSLRDGEPVAPDGSVSIVTGGASIFLPLEGLIDVEAERSRIHREIEQVRGEISRAEAMLANEQFVARAPAQVVNGHRERLLIAQERLGLLESRLRDLG
jgi:valyl-tRNA synthetase